MEVTTEIGCEWELLTKSEKNGRINHLLMKLIYVLLTCDFQLTTDTTQKSSGGICVSPEEPISESLWNPLVSPYGTQRNSTDDPINNSIKKANYWIIVRNMVWLLPGLSLGKGELLVCIECSKFV